MLALLLTTAFAGPWVTFAPGLTFLVDPSDGFAPLAGAVIDTSIGEDHGFELRARVLAVFNMEFQATGIGTVELGWRPRLADQWRLGPVLALDVDGARCTGTSPPFCDGASLSVAARRGEPTDSDADQLDIALGTELSRALGDRMAIRPRARVSLRHRTGLTGAIDFGLHLQTMLLRAEVGYTFVFGPRDRP
ncbi:MAG: hypothetical protein KC912_14390 [Proteobacteria bacterium]|nr:hypothetical protein [Pseudomonadota bacterium]